MVTRCVCANRPSEFFLRNWKKVSITTFSLNSKHLVAYALAKTFDIIISIISYCPSPLIYIISFVKKKKIVLYFFLVITRSIFSSMLQIRTFSRYYLVIQHVLKNQPSGESYEKNCINYSINLLHQQRCLEK